MASQRRIHRRQYLATFGVTGGLAAAGCASSDSEFTVESEETDEYELEFDVSAGAFFDDTTLLVTTTSRVVNDADYILLYADDEQVDWEPLREVGTVEYSLAEHSLPETFVLEVIEGGSVGLDVHNGGTALETVSLRISG